MGSDKENKRKCYKCGRSPATDGCTLYRFPKPGIRNLLRCELWAKYIAPEKDYLSVAFQAKLHNEHRMLCNRHFKATDFADVEMKQLFRHAVPSEVVTPTTPATLQLAAFSCEPQAGPSHLADVTNTRESILKTKSAASSQLIENNTEEKQRKTENENKLYTKCVKYMKRASQLRNKLNKMKNKDLLNTLIEDQDIIKLSKKLTPAFALLLQAQIRNTKKKLTGRRWAKDEKILALRIYKRSPTCYRLLRRMFPLPAPNTLKNLLNKVPFAVGANMPVFKVLTEYIKTQKNEDNEYVLMWDAMSLRKNLAYNSKTDLIDGFQDHGLQGRTPEVASYALVFMIAGIRKKVKQPVAHYFSSSYVSADRLAVLIKEVLNQCISSGINISALVCDMDGVNRRAVSILGATVDQPYVTFQGHEIVSLFDPPHLLKCFRNLFLKYDIQCSVNITSGCDTGIGLAKWSHIKEFYEMDSVNPNFVFAPALRKEHLAPNAKQKMRVNLAAQVLSHTVAAGMYSKISDGKLAADAVITANVIASMDKLFDCMNSDSSDLRRGKPCSTNLTKYAPHLKLFAEMKKFFKSLIFVGSPRSPPSQEGWVWTINAMERLWHKISLKHNSLATRRLQQDPIENLFGSIRANCGSNTNPTTVQFLAGLKTSVLSNLAHIGTSGNCEADNNIIINNFNTLLTASQNTTQTQTYAFADIVHEKLNELVSAADDNSGEIQACTYVCGYIFKRMNWDCEKCKDMYVSKDIETYHNFVEFKEYTETKKNLQYIKRDIVSCVESCASLVNSILEKNAHLSGLKKHCIEVLTNSRINFEFLYQCPQHTEKNQNFISSNVFEIIVKRFCVLKNRSFAEEASASALKKKMNIILHK